MSTPSGSAARRRVVANISLSLDGRTNGPQGDQDMSWIVPHAVSEQSRDHMTGLIQTASTALLGRKNFEGFGGFWPGVAQMAEADPRDRAFSRWLNESEKVVFSTTVDRTDWANTRFTNERPSTVVQQLRAQPGGDILVLASVSVIKSLLADGEIDRLSVTLCPEISGGGIRLFEDGLPATSWTLDSSIPTSSGALCLLYDHTTQR